MKKLNWFFVIVLVSSFSIAAQEVPTCSKPSVYDLTVTCKDNKIEDCRLAKWENFLAFPVNKNVVTSHGEDRYICLDSKPGRVGKNGYSGSGKLDEGLLFSGRCEYMIKISADRPEAFVLVGIKGLPRAKPYANEADNILIFNNPGTYQYYVNVIDYYSYFFQEGDSRYSLYTACRDVQPIMLNINYDTTR